MSWIEVDTEAGFYTIDDETGEVCDFPVGTDKVAGLVRTLHGAKAQAKEWDKVVAILTQAVMREQADQKVLYGDVVATKRQDSYSYLDLEGLREDLAAFELTTEELRQSVLAAKSFDATLLPAPVSALVKQRTLHKTKSPWVDVQVVKKSAPRLRAVGAAS